MSNIQEELQKLAQDLPSEATWDDVVRKIHQENKITSNQNLPTDKHNTTLYNPANITVIGVISGILGTLPFIPGAMLWVPLAIVCGAYGALNKAEKAWTAIILGLVGWVVSPTISPFAINFALKGIGA